jgi:predicted DNA-binding transcriptional regulator AlpA
MSRERFLSPGAVADRIGYTVATLAMWRVKGKGPKFVKFGTSQQARVRYPESEVLAWEAEQPHLSNTGQSSAA